MWKFYLIYSYYISYHISLFILVFHALHSHLWLHQSRSLFSWLKVKQSLWKLRYSLFNNHACMFTFFIYLCFLIGCITLCTCLYVGMKWDDVYQNFFLIFKKILFIYFEGKGKRGRKRERETSLCGCLSYTPYWGPGPQPSMCPDWEPNWWPFGSQASIQPSEPPQPGQCQNILKPVNA